MTVTDKAVAWALETAADDKHGYDQASRWGVDYDCSSFVITAFQRAGVPLTCTFTGNMRADMLANGFALVQDGTLRAGDVLLNEKSHTALYIGNGQLVQASSNEHGGITGGAPGDQTGREISTRPYYDFPWDCVLRYKDQSAAAEPAAEYTVKSGDTLWGLAERWLGAGYKYTEILGANSITSMTLYPGQRLKIPGVLPVPETILVKVHNARFETVQQALLAAGITAELA